MTFPQIDPVLVSIGPFAVRWYGLMYLFGFASAWLLGRYRAKRTGEFTVREFDDILTWGCFGVLVGARLGYVLFYDFAYYLQHPLEVFYVQRGGMSFHGGMLGVIFFMWFAAHRRGKTLFQTMDFVAPLVPPGLFFGRLGNFINGELWGRVTDAPVGMIFPDGGNLPRHPSQLYEAGLEGIVFFCLLWAYSAKPRPRTAVSGFFLLGYGTFRFIVEFFREPDAHLGFVAFNVLSMGQLLCVPMIMGGALLMLYAYRKNRPA
ncbi:phosphatidylglycerol-prolipoprotein diacylglyceryl transferase [uncultured delta proteobacterium]|uniref:Phosphatidylglycerol--prolipoprotein diacylglyceryl transferase n=1 Tax=uncultured delta proteobacterium TaxID=34034 RepID=A0A212JHV8_9DELT|nr:phosphatidylglycerol-prolipoprotein diacylglyceryl transferase [uncultured delta proteobacterium]